MQFTYLIQMQREIERRILARTGRRIRNLRIVMSRDSIVLRGQAVSYYVKQLAQHGVHEFLPHIHLENGIIVDRNLGAIPGRLVS